jgi:hypothetical protein
MPVDGRVVLGILATPLVFGTIKSMYWSNQLRKLNDREVLSERYVLKYSRRTWLNRFTWLYKCMLDDEIERTILLRTDKSDPIVLGGSSVPS